jgi:hypothetical protein
MRVSKTVRLSVLLLTCIAIVILICLYPSRQGIHRIVSIERVYFAPHDSVMAAGVRGDFEEQARMEQGGRSFYGFRLFSAWQDADRVDTLLKKFVSDKGRLPIGSGEYFTTELLSHAAEGSVAAHHRDIAKLPYGGSRRNGNNGVPVLSSSSPMVLLVTRLLVSGTEQVVFFAKGPEVCENFRQTDDFIIAVYTVRYAE